MDWLNARGISEFYDVLNSKKLANTTFLEELRRLKTAPVGSLNELALHDCIRDLGLIGLAKVHFMSGLSVLSSGDGVPSISNQAHRPSQLQLVTEHEHAVDGEFMRKVYLIRCWNLIEELASPIMIEVLAHQWKSVYSKPNRPARYCNACKHRHDFDEMSVNCFFWLSSECPHWVYTYSIQMAKFDPESSNAREVFRKNFDVGALSHLITDWIARFGGVDSYYLGVNIGILHKYRNWVCHGYELSFERYEECFYGIKEACMALLEGFDEEFKARVEETTKKTPIEVRP